MATTMVMRCGLFIFLALQLMWLCGCATAPKVLPQREVAHAYAYDNLGNRQSGGDASSPTLYTANNLNQYTGILTPGLQDIMGAALATNRVTVNGGLADRHGEYFHRQISVANTNQAVWQEVTNISGTFTNQGGLVFPANNQTLVYDADGNLSFDGVWNYQWDGENRLISMTMTNVANIAATNRLKLDFAYDYLGRRIEKKVSHWNSGSWLLDSESLFVYDGWNLLATINPQSSILVSFVWGQDLSGTMTQAGGVGGLLIANLSGTNCFTAYDGNGNVTALINAGDKTVAARYEYSPYGELLRETGLLAHQMPFRFSTKFWDEETGLVYYGHRYYSQKLGRWISKDWIAEQGGINLYVFLHNKAFGSIDPIGDIGLFVTLVANSGDAAEESTEVEVGETLISQIKNAISSMNNLQEFEAGYEEGNGLDVDGMLLSIQAAQSALAQNLRGAKSGAKAAALVDDMHHIFPQAGSLAKFFSKNNINPDGALTKINGYLHRFGMHAGGGGGAYNDIWDQFAKKNQNMKNNPYYVMGFGFGLMMQVAPELKF